MVNTQHIFLKCLKEFFIKNCKIHDLFEKKAECGTGIHFLNINLCRGMVGEGGGTEFLMRESKGILKRIRLKQKILQKLILCVCVLDIAQLYPAVWPVVGPSSSSVWNSSLAENIGVGYKISTSQSLHDPGIKLGYPALHADSLQLSHHRSP